MASTSGPDAEGSRPDDGEEARPSDGEPESALETARRQLRRAAAHLDIDPDVVERLAHPKQVHEVTVQGYGSVGANAARLLDEWGADVVAVSDVSGGIYDPDGLDTRSIPSHREEPEAVLGHEAPATVTNEELLELDVDVLIPAAVGNVLTADDAVAVAAEIDVEGANGPTTSAASEALAERGVHVIPDILANAGGVTVSYFGWLQDINRRPWTLDRVHEELESEMRSAWDRVREEYEARDVAWREAAYVVALSRVAEAHEARGLWP